MCAYRNGNNASKILLLFDNLYSSVTATPKTFLDDSRNQPKLDQPPHSKLVNQLTNKNVFVSKTIYYRRITNKKKLSNTKAYKLIMQTVTKCHVLMISDITGMF